MSKVIEKVYKLDLVSTLALGTSSNFTTSFIPSLLFSGECEVALYSVNIVRQQTHLRLLTFGPYNVLLRYMHVK